MTTREIDEIVHKATVSRNSYPSPLNYHGNIYNIILIYVILYTMHYIQLLYMTRTLCNHIYIHLIYAHIYACIGFPKSCCTSVNEIICHGIPDTTVLQDGDIVNIDVTVFHDGVHGDCSETVFVGEYYVYRYISCAYILYTEHIYFMWYNVLWYVYSYTP